MDDSWKAMKIKDESVLLAKGGPEMPKAEG